MQHERDMIIGTCHCGAVKVTLPEQPAWVSDCNCSICRRYGVLWSYFIAKSVKTESAPEALVRYAWGRKELSFVHCRSCGCVMWWERVTPDPEKKMGVNLRMFDPTVLAAAQVEKLNGAEDW
jgi:hypothetical protein